MAPASACRAAGVTANSWAGEGRVPKGVDLEEVASGAQTFHSGRFRSHRPWHRSPVRCQPCSKRPPRPKEWACRFRHPAPSRGSGRGQPAAPGSPGGLRVEFVQVRVLRAGDEEGQEGCAERFIVVSFANVNGTAVNAAVDALQASGPHYERWGLEVSKGKGMGESATNKDEITEWRGGCSFRGCEIVPSSGTAGGDETPRLSTSTATALRGGGPLPE
jgi:hypothetical protein